MLVGELKSAYLMFYQKVGERNHDLQYVKNKRMVLFEDGQKRRILSLFILVFQGFGIRILDGIISSPILFWTVFLFIINFRQIQKNPPKCWRILFAFFIFYFAFNILKGVQPSFFLYAGWLSAFFVLSNYIDGENSFIDDLYSFTRLCVYYDLWHIVVFVGLHPLLLKTNFNMSPSTIFYIFYYNVEEGFGGFPRIQGFCWEPSCWNCLLNLNLALVLVLGKSRKEIVFAVAAIVTVFSTTGFATMLIIIGIYILLFSKKISWSTRSLFAILLMIVFPIAQDNIVEKLKIGSGATRYGDFFAAMYIIYESPWLGGDLDNITSNDGAMIAKADNWGIDASQLSQYAEVGMTNSFAGLFVEWGVVVTFILFILMYKSPLFENKKQRFLVVLTILVVLMGTPIARTGFFYLFPLSTLIYNVQKRRNDTHFHYHRDL